MHCLWHTQLNLDFFTAYVLPDIPEYPSPNLLLFPYPDDWLVDASGAQAVTKPDNEADRLWITQTHWPLHREISGTWKRWLKEDMWGDTRKNMELLVHAAANFQVGFLSLHLVIIISRTKSVYIYIPWADFFLIFRIHWSVLGLYLLLRGYPEITLVQFW